MRISDIIRADFRSIISNTSALLVCAVLALLPSAYAWFNIIASWDPYSNTANLKVAIASEDQGVTSLGHHINIGDQVLENLKDNTQMGWIFTDPTTATSGVKHGDYYASVVIGSGFSADMMSFLSNEPKKPTLHYTVNEKINAIVPKITQKGVEGIEAQIESAFLGSLNESIFSEANSRGTQLARMRTDIEKTRSLIDEIVPQLPRIHEAIEHTENLSQTGIHAIERVQNTLPDLESRLDRIRSVTGNRTEVHHTLESILVDIPPFVQTQMVSLRGLMHTGINMAGAGNEFFSESADLLIPRLKGIERRMIIAKHIVHSLNTLFQALNQFVPIFSHGQTRTAQLENEIGKYIVLIQRASNMLTRGESLTHDLQGELMQRANAVES